MTNPNTIRQKLRDQQTTLRSVDRLDNLKTLTDTYRNDLASVLDMTDDFIVTDETVKDFKTTTNILDASIANPWLLKELNTKKTNINNAIVALWAPPLAPDIINGATYKDLSDQLMKINTMIDAIPDLTGNTAQMRTDYKELLKYQEYFDTTQKLQNAEIDLLIPVPRAGPRYNQDLNALFKTVAGNPTPKYTLCNDQWKPLTKNGADYVLQIGWQAVTLSGINLAADRLDISNLKITPPTADISQPLKLSIEWRYDNVWGTAINTIHRKDIEIQLRKWPKITPLNTPADREIQVDAYNNSGWANVIVNSIQNLSDNNLAIREREAVFRAIKHNDGPKFDMLNADQQEDLYQNTRRLINPPDGNSPLIGAGNFTYVAFRNWLTADKNPWNTPENIKDIASYIKYIHDNLEKMIPDFFAKKMDEMRIDNLHMNTFLKSKVSIYLSSIERQKKDNDVHEDIDNDIKAGKWGKMINKRRKILGMRIGRRDVNWFRFFNGSKKSISNQEVNISTNDKPVNLNRPQPVKYGMELEISGKNSLSAKIDIEGQESFTLKNGDTGWLIRDILKYPWIEHGKTRAHIAYNVIKGMIELAKEKWIDMNYRDSVTGHNMIIKIDKDNILLEDQDDKTNYGTTNRRITKKIFDYQLFKNTNTFDGGSNRSLRWGIENLMSHMNLALNQAHAQYRKASERKRTTKTDFPTSFWTNPLKKILNLRTTTNFDFQTNVTGANGKSATIEFKKNIFTITSDGIKKPISSRSLGKLLEHRVGKIRVFDGIEREICGKVYEEMIQKLRENTKIARSNFAVKDNITGRVYVLDEDGKMWYIPAERPNPIRKMNAAKLAGKAAFTWGLLAGGSMTGGASTLGIPLTRSGAATAWLRTWGWLSAAGLATYAIRNWKRDYGVVLVPPPGRIMCTEEETKSLFKNPLLMGRMVKAVNERLGRF